MKRDRILRADLLAVTGLALVVIFAAEGDLAMGLRYLGAIAAFAGARAVATCPTCRDDKFLGVGCL